MKNKKSKKILSLALALVMVLSLIPFAALTVLSAASDYNAHDVAKVKAFLIQTEGGVTNASILGCDPDDPDDWGSFTSWITDNGKLRLHLLNISGNALHGNLDLSECEFLTEIGCYDNLLTGIDVSGCVNLWWFDCSYNKITELDVSGCVEMWSLYADNNKLVSLDVSDCVDLYRLFAHYNPLDDATIAALKALGLKELSYTCMDKGIRKSFAIYDRSFDDEEIYYPAAANNISSESITPAVWITQKFTVISTGKGFAEWGEGFHVYPDDGYAFLEWRDITGGFITNTPIDPSNPYFDAEFDWEYEGEASITARFSDDEYKVTYDKNGGSGTGPTETDKTPGETFKVSDNTFYPPTGKYFAGWNTEADGSGDPYDADDDITMYYDDIVLYAQWLFETYNITYLELNGATNSNPDTYTYGSGFSLADPGPRAGYRFVGWYDSQEDDANKITEITDTDTGSKYLTANWIVVYPVTYDANGGTGTAPAETDKATGETFDAKTNTFTPPAGKQFVAWNTEADGTGIKYVEGAQITMGQDAITLYAIWEDAPTTTTTTTTTTDINTTTDTNTNTTTTTKEDNTYPDVTDPTAGIDNTTNSTVPETGVDSNMTLWLFFCVTSLCILGMTVTKKRKSSE